MPINLNAILSALFVIIFSSTGYSAKVICSAEGNNLRKDGKPHPVSARLEFRLVKTDSPSKFLMTRYVGHIAGSNFNIKPPETILSNSDAYYGVFTGKDKNSSLSPQATKYTDDSYLRFRDFNATSTNGQDGGGMWGYFVVNKQALDGVSKNFDAHFVFSAGDHMGGTVDFNCKPQ